jgi:hypothetical protein
MASIEESKLDAHSSSDIKELLTNLIQGKPHLKNKYKTSLDKSLSKKSY